MQRKRLDNFKHWRDEMKRRGLIKSSYPALKKDDNLAELLGVVLGDGHIYMHDRCDSLRVVGDAAKMGFVIRAAYIIHAVFGKRPRISKRKKSNAVNVTLYEKHISKRLGIPAGARRKSRFILPVWIERSKSKKIRFLRGLYEAEGTLCHSPATYTHKFIFTNMNAYLLKLVARLVRELGFTVSVSANKVQVSRKHEVQKLSNLIKFRNYEE